MLMAAVVVIGTYILVSQAYGFDVNTKTGQVFQNGLVYIDSAPDGAKILINGVEQKNKTNHRLALPAGQYSLEVAKDGYRPWKRNFEVEGGQVERFTYPMLFPQELQTNSLLTIGERPRLVMQSPDRRWVLIQKPGSLTAFTQYDLNNLKDKRPQSQGVVFPRNVFSQSTGVQRLELVEWSTDNKNILVKHTFKGGVEYVVLNRDKPEESVNVNLQLGINPTRVVLRDKKPDKLYLYFSKTGRILTADLKKKTTEPVLTNVINFKSHGADVILYAQKVPGSPKIIRTFIKEKDKTYILRDSPTSAKVPLEIAQYDGQWYVAVGSDAEQKTYIYKDPTDFLRRTTGQKPVPVMVLKSTGPANTLSFSQNTRFIMVNNGQHFSVYDAENEKGYRYNLNEKFDEKIKPVWMDGHRLLVHSGGQVVVFDYDGTNVQELVASDPSLPAVFNRDYTFLYTVSPNSKTYYFNQTQLRLDEDL